MKNNPHHQWLGELTSLPTAAGRELRVVQWIERWARQRRNCQLSRDRHGNITIQRRGGASRKKAAGHPPIYFTAHMDHPAFVVREIRSDREVIADFRGGVADAYFTDARVMLHRLHSPPSQGGAGGGSGRRSEEAGGNSGESSGENSGGSRERRPVSSKRSSSLATSPTLPRPLPQREGSSKPAIGRIIELMPIQPGKTQDKAALIRFSAPHRAAVGDVLTWKLAATTIKRDRVAAPACDDLAGVAAALAAFDVVHAARPAVDVRLLLTRCEEVGFVGAIGACKAKTIERNALVIALENSRSFAESPIGGGPIVRVGDRTSTFDPDLTYRIGKVAEALAGEDKSFIWQRKLMTGGTCEASAYQSFGHIATCLCLPLGNYHNQNESTRRIDHEIISLRDFDNLIKLLAAIGRRLHDPKLAPPLKPRLETLFRGRKKLLE